MTPVNDRNQSSVSHLRASSLTQPDSPWPGYNGSMERMLIGHGGTANGFTRYPHDTSRSSLPASVLASRDNSFERRRKLPELIGSPLDGQKYFPSLRQSQELSTDAGDQQLEKQLQEVRDMRKLLRLGQVYE